MEFPRFVFISPGPIECQGGTYNQELTKNQVEYDAAIKAGFSSTIPDALAVVKDIKALKVTQPRLVKGEVEKLKLIHRNK